MSRRLLFGAVAALAVVPAAAHAENICAPSSPAGYYACASYSLQWDDASGLLILSVRNLDSWTDATMTTWAGGYLLTGVGLTGTPTLSATGLAVSTQGSVNKIMGAESEWNLTTDLSGNLAVDAGATTGPGTLQPGSIVGCTLAGSTWGFQTCDGMGYTGAVTFAFSGTGLNATSFANTTWAFSLRGIAGPEGVSFKCGPDATPCTTTTTPEPASMLLMAFGLLGTGAVARRRRRIGVEDEA